MTPSVYSRYRTAFVEALAQALGMPASELDAQVKPAADPAHGDLSFPTFPLAKAQKKAPLRPSPRSLAQGLKVPGLEIAAAGPYVNARFAPLPFNAEVIDAARSQGVRYGGGGRGRGPDGGHRLLLAQHRQADRPSTTSAPRSSATRWPTCTGRSATAWRASTTWGTGASSSASWPWASRSTATRRDARTWATWSSVYVKANKRAESEPAFDERARDFFRRMEAGEPEALALWKEFRETSVRDFKRIYARLGIQFEHIEGESFYQGKMEPGHRRRSPARSASRSRRAPPSWTCPTRRTSRRCSSRRTMAARSTPRATWRRPIDRHERFHFDQVALRGGHGPGAALPPALRGARRPWAATSSSA